MNILLSSAGRQVFLINAFREALSKKGKVFASDVDSSALSLNAADEGLVAPAFTSEQYIPWLLQVCKEKNINLLVTLNVDDLIILEKNRHVFLKEECVLVGGSLEMIEQTYDKWKLYKFCQKIGLDVPETYLIGDISAHKQSSFPLLAKPRYGKGSRGLKILNTQNELTSFVGMIKKNETSTPYVIQSFVKGQEYGLDLVNNFDSEYAGVFVRRKVAMKNGETFEAISESPDNWAKMANKLSRGLKHQGTVDIDVIKSGSKIYIIDINHRFGGGYIFSHIAGANLPMAYISWMLGEKMNEKYLKPKPNVLSKRNGLGIGIVTQKSEL